MITKSRHATLSIFLRSAVRAGGVFPRVVQGACIDSMSTVTSRSKTHSKPVETRPQKSFLQGFAEGFLAATCAEVTTIALDTAKVMQALTRTLKRAGQACRHSLAVFLRIADMDPEGLGLEPGMDISDEKRQFTMTIHVELRGRSVCSLTL